MAQRIKVTLATDDLVLLQGVLLDAQGDPSRFPPESERRERLDRWLRRLDEQIARRGQEVRLTEADWDVLDACLGRRAGRLRADARALFDTVVAGSPRDPASQARLQAAAEAALAELDRIDGLVQQFRDRLTRELGRPPRRPWILR